MNVYGIVDLGSNTIRLSIYEYEGQVVKLLINKKETVGLSSYISDSVLSLKGIATACFVLNGFKKIADNFNIEDLYVFATASLRNITNTEEAIELIKENTGLTVDLLSGEDEARLDYIGFSNYVGCDNGLLIDIGGGSTELVTFQNSEIQTAVSIPIGSLNLFLKNVADVIPGKSEMKDIKKHVKSELKALEFFENYNCSMIYGVGGSARATRKLYNDIFGQASDNSILDTEKLKELLAMIKEGKRSMVYKILQLSPERVHTIIPGMIILYTIAKEANSDAIFISDFGVRDGYLHSKVLGL